MVYERIKNLREDKDLSQQKVADYLHITQRTYSRYERGDRSIPTEILAQLAEFHSTSTDYLLGLTDVKVPYHKNRPGKRPLS